MSASIENKVWFHWRTAAFGGIRIIGAVEVITETD